MERPGAPLVTAALAVALAIPATAGAAEDAALLARHAPVLVHDSRDRFPAAAVQRGAAPEIYGRAAPAAGGGRWLQYWRWHAYNLQDRGIVRTGRHEGDWELTQVRVNRAGMPVEAVYAQHSGAERCGWGRVQRRGDAPVAYLANGSHAAYFRPGLRDRTFPDPNDEANGRGLVLRPRLVLISERSPSWMRRRSRWGKSRARLPFESSSPLGPAFQPQGRWSDPSRFTAEHARSCAAGRCDEQGECDGRETALAGGGAAGAALLGLVLLRRRRFVGRARRQG